MIKFGKIVPDYQNDYIPIFQHGKFLFGPVAGYFMYHLFYASHRLWRLLDNHDLDKGYLTSSRRDVSDTEWFTFSKVFLQSLPWISLHTIGTQFFQRQNQSALSIFHFLISLLHLNNALGLKPTLLLVCQPL